MSNEDDELITIREGCAIIGGKAKPVHPATFYRGVRDGRYTPPVHPSPGISRLWKKRLLKDLARIIADEDGTVST